MSKRDNFLLVEDMLQACRKIKKYTEGQSFEVFDYDDKTVDAVVRNFEVIGEAAIELIDESFKNTNSYIEWHRLRGFRNRIVHEYFGIDNRIVWTIIENNLDELISNLEKLIRMNEK